MNNPLYLSEELAARLPGNVKDAIRSANFNGYGWALIAPEDEISGFLVTLKLARLVQGQFVITNQGMRVRAVISRKTPSVRFASEAT